MSDRVTWETCPSCGRPPAVGWTTVLWIDGKSVTEIPEEYDGTSGCRIDPEQLRHTFNDAN